MAACTDQVGTGLDHDVRPEVVQPTPPGSPCSVVIAAGMPLGEPGSLNGPQLVVEDIDGVRTGLAGRGVPISEVMTLVRAFFTHPDGNGWSVQDLRS